MKEDEVKAISNPNFINEEDNKIFMPSLKAQSVNTDNEILNRRNKQSYLYIIDTNFEKDYKPPEEIIIKTENKKNSNIPILNMINENNIIINGETQLKNLKIKENCLLIDNIHRDGNCFFRAISSFFTGTEQYHLYFRKIVHKYIKDNKDDIIIEFPYVYYNGKLIDIEDYIPLINKNSNYAGELECNLLQR